MIQLLANLVVVTALGGALITVVLVVCKAVIAVAAESSIAHCNVVSGRRCRYCGSVLSEDASKCDYCGAGVKA